MIQVELRPNVNSAYMFRGETRFEMVEVSTPGGPPFGLVHVDAFYRKEDRALHERLTSGESVIVELRVVGPAVTGP